MVRRKVFGLALAVGVGLVGCQNTPRTGTMGSSLPATQTNLSQSTGWGDKSTVTQTGGMTTGMTSPSSRSPLGGSPSPAPIDPSAFPRNSQDAMPRQIGNQVSQYTTVPTAPSDPTMQPPGNFARTPTTPSQQPGAMPQTSAPATRPTDPTMVPNGSGVSIPAPPRQVGAPSPVTGLTNDPYQPAPDVFGPRTSDAPR